MKLLLATANAHKIEEISALLGNLDLEIVSLAAFPDLQMPAETGAAMRENARLKAFHCARETGLASLADDSGIEVDALSGAPGVRSARWIEGSDEDRTRALLDKLKSTPLFGRTSRYRCAICLAWPLGENLSYDGEVHCEEAEATCEGRIANELRGENGFGYDPVFELTNESGAPEWVGKTMAQVPPEIKAQVSHRARAIEKIKPVLRELSK